MYFVCFTQDITLTNFKSVFTLTIWVGDHNIPINVIQLLSTKGFHSLKCQKYKTILMIELKIKLSI